MHDIKKYIQKIVDDGDREEMEKLSDMLQKVSKMVYDYDEREGKQIEIELYEMAYGKRLTDDMKREWVKNMRPSPRWSEEEIYEIADGYGVDIPVLSLYVIMNKFYSDQRKSLEDENEERTLKRYIEAANCWYFDPDATNSEEAKLYCYWKYIVN